MSEIKINFAFLCDDARREDNGKLIFIGAYGQSIILQNLPSNLVLCLVMNLFVEKPLETSIGFRVRLDEQAIVEGGAVISAARGSNFSVFPGIPVVAEKLGNLSVQVKFGQDEWITATSIELTRASNSTA